MKRILSLLLALALCLAAVAAHAERESCAQTPLPTSSARRNNIELAASAISGLTLSYGEEFSFNDLVGPRIERYGYELAANGRGAEVIGGGVAQVASTLYLALSEGGMDVEYTNFQTYGSSFVGDYVADPADAILVDFNADIDFSFINYENELYIQLWSTDDQLCCTVNVDPTVAAPLVSSFRRPLSSAILWIDGSDAVRENILLAAASINDTVLSEGDLFSFNDVVGPRSERFGYRLAVNGRGVEVIGGGVAQVASAIWLAVKNLDGVAIVEKSTYGSRYSQSYVSSSNDAILTDYSNGTDFSFRNTAAEPLRISVYLDGDALCCEIYRD